MTSTNDVIPISGSILAQSPYRFPSVTSRGPMGFPMFAISSAHCKGTYKGPTVTLNEGPQYTPHPAVKKQAEKK